MDPTQFDELTKALATSTSRRQALRRIGGTLTGAVLASLLPGRVLANGGGNSACAHFCNAFFGADTPLADQCISEAAHHQGLCYACGPGSCGGDGCCSLAGAPCSVNTNCCCGFCDTTTNTCVFGCFTAGTLIAMADGTSRPIEHVLMGDLVLGNGGRINRVTHIQRPLLGNRSLYAMNESGFFVTAGHPFMTEAGWKSIDPAATAVENPALRVNRLTIGDRLLSLMAAAVPVGAGGSIPAEAVDVRIETISLHSLVGQLANPATQLYNLQLDGNHTYFANDLLVHNK